jgi:ankyrin repeat protein
MPITTPLLDAIRYTHVTEDIPYNDPPSNVISDLLNQGCDVNQMNDKGETALMAAAERCYFDTARLLLDRGADVNAADQNGRTALMRAVEATAGRGMRPAVAAKIVSLLLAQGANASDKDTRGRTASDQLTGKTLSDLDAHNVTLLLDATVPEKPLLNSLLTTCANSLAASWGSETKTTVDIHGAILNLLLDLVRRGADVNTPNDKGWTPLMRVIKLGPSRFEVAKALLTAGADINAKARDGTTVCSAYAQGYGGEWKAVVLRADETHYPIAVLNFLSTHGCTEATELLSERSRLRLESKRQQEQFLLEKERIRQVQSDRAERRLCVLCGRPLGMVDQIAKRARHKGCDRFLAETN